MNFLSPAHSGILHGFDDKYIVLYRNLVCVNELFIQAYNMNARSKGIIFILNNMTFLGNVKQRAGSDIDVTNIIHVFKEIGYNVQLAMDCKANVNTKTHMP